jgi:PAS domain S-box-containing protein
MTQFLDPTRIERMKLEIRSLATTLRDLSLEEWEAVSPEVEALHQALRASPVVRSAMPDLPALESFAAKVAERQEIERTLRENEARYRLLVELSPDMIFVQAGGRFVFINPAGLRLLGLDSPHQILEKPVLEHIHPDDRHKVAERIRLLNEERVPVAVVEERFIRQDGRLVSLEVLATPIDFDGQPAALVIAHDISLRKQLELDLRTSEASIHESEERFRLAGRSVDGIVYDYNLTTGEVYRSEGLEKVIGIRPENLPPTREAWLDRIHPEDRERINAPLQEHLKTIDENYERVYRVRHEDGRWVYVQENGVLVRDHAGRPLRLVGTTIDITKRMHSEQVLRESEGRFRAMADGTPVIIWVTDAASQIEFVNKAYSDFFGVGLEQLQREGWQPLVHPEDISRYVDVFIACTREQRPFRAQCRTLRQDGQWRWIDSQAQPRFSDSGGFLGMAGSSLDITERVQAEETLRESEAQVRRSRELLHAIIDNANAAIYAKDLQGRFILSNRYHARIVGKPAREVVGKKDENFVDETEKAAMYSNHDRQVLAEGQPIEFEEVAPGPDGGERTYLSVKFPLRAPDGAIYGVCGISTDITDRKLNEEAINRYAVQLEQLNKDLAYANRELRDFAYIASHDLQEPLRKVSKFGELLHDRYGTSLEQNGREYVERMVDAARRMQEMIDGLLHYSRISTRGNPFVMVNLENTSREVLSDLEIRVEQTEGQVDLGSLPTIEADPLQMRQLLQNLIGNALKFHHPNARPVVKIWAEDCPDADRSTDCVSLFVQDHGIGFDQAFADKLFEPFMRLHGRSEYEGTGMGLAICRKIVERHGGRIWANSQPDLGTTFTVILPKSQARR